MGNTIGQFLGENNNIIKVSCVWDTNLDHSLTKCERMNGLQFLKIFI